MKEKTLKCFRLLMLFAALLANIKNIFVDYNGDGGYAVATAQRLIDGDGLFLRMWEPHQTSSFVMAGLMKIYESVFHTKEGIVLFLNISGFVLYVLVAIVFYAVIKEFTDKNTAFLMTFLILVLRPKLVQIPDYANLAILFSVLMFAFLVKYFLRGNKIFDLIAASFFLFLDALSYPSCIVISVGVIVCLLIYSKKKLRDIVISMGICLFFGCAYLIIPIHNLGFGGFFGRILEVVKGDSHSGGSIYSGINYFKELILGAVILAACVLVSLIIKKVLDAVKRNAKVDFAGVLAVVVTVAFCVESLIIGGLVKDSNIAIWCIDKIVIVAVIVMGFFCYKDLNDNQKCVYVVSMIVSGGTLIGVVALTNLSFLTVFCYAHLAVTASIMALSAHCEKKEEKQDTVPVSKLSIACVFIVLFVQGTCNLGTVENYVRTGPLKGMVTTLEQCNYNKISVEEWSQNVSETDSVLIANEYGSDPILYILTDAKISVNSTISTPTFGDMLKKYWEIYPDREPSVIAVPCWEGRETRVVPVWLDTKIMSEYERTSVGTCWIFYRKK